MVRKYISKAREKTTKFHREFRKHAVTAMIAAFGFLIALSWRDFVSDTVNQIVKVIGVSDQLYLYKLLSAITVTFLAILGIMIVTKLKIDDENQKKN